MTGDKASAAEKTGQGVPWVRLLLLIAALLGGALAVWYESNARKVLARARSLEDGGSYSTAFLAYVLVVEKYPFSLCVFEGRSGVDRLEAPGIEAGFTRHMGASGANWLRERLDPYEVDYMPLVLYPLAGLVSLIVLVSRLRGRRFVAFLAFMGLLVAALGTSILAVRCRLIGAPSPDIQGLADSAQSVYVIYGGIFAVGASVILGLTARTRGGTAQ